MWTLNHCNGWYSNVWRSLKLHTPPNPPPHIKALLPSLSVSTCLRAGMGGMGEGGGNSTQKNEYKKKPEERSDLLCIHLSLRINKGNLGWFLPVGLLADGRGERSDTAELRGAEITLKHTRQITAPVWESLILILVSAARNSMWCNMSLRKIETEWKWEGSLCPPPLCFFCVLTQRIIWLSFSFFCKTFR